MMKQLTEKTGLRGKFAGLIAAFAQKFAHRVLEADRLFDEMREARFEKTLSEMEYDVARAFVVARLRGWSFRLACAADLADAVSRGGSHYCAFWRGCRLFRKNHVHTSTADCYGDAARKLIAESASELDLPLEALRLRLAVEAA